MPEPLLAPPEGHDWELLWSSEHPAYGGNGAQHPSPDRGLGPGRPCRAAAAAGPALDQAEERAAEGARQGSRGPQARREGRNRYERAALVAEGDRLPDLPALLPGQRRRRHRRPRRHPRQRLDYLDWLGVDAVWLSPIYPSPMADFGYDVADYTGIHPMFGTLADFDRLVEAAARPRHAAHPRLRAEPHLRPSTPGSRRPGLAATTRSATGTSGATRPRTAGRPTTGRANAGGAGLDLRRGHRPVLLPRLPARAAGPQLAQPGGPGGDVRRACASGSTRASTASGST